MATVAGPVPPASPPQPAAAIPAKRQAKGARLWWHVHQWVGLKLSLFMAFILMTGSLATLSHEIDWLLQPSLRVAPSSVTGEPDWAKIGASTAAYPGISQVLSINEPVASAFAATAMVQWDNGDYGYLHLHPTTGEIQGIGPWVGAQRILRNMHRHINIPTKYGVPIVSALSVLLLISLITSLIVYKKWWRGFTRLPRARSARTWWGDVHRLAGVWSLWFVALIAVTGLWYLVESLGGDAARPPEGEIVEGGVKPVQLAPALTIALKQVRATDPDLAIQSIRFPDENDARFIIEGQRSAWLVRPRANAVYADARSGDLSFTTDATDMTVHQRISEMADPLHFGTFGGYWTKIPWFLFGLAMTALSVSGIAIYALRIARDTADRLVWANHVRRMWLGMGRWRWLSALLITIAMVFLIPLALGIEQ